MNEKMKTRMISVTGGKGGVGKTFFSINLALQLAREGLRVCLFDADLGLSNIDVMLGLNPVYTLADLFMQKKSLRDILIKNYQGIDIIPGGSGIEYLAQLPPDSLDDLVRSFAELDEYDFILFDTAAGISKNVVSFCLAARELIVVITPEPTSITDAYALLKVLDLNELRARVMVVFNQIKKVVTAKKAFQLFDETVQKHLRLKVKPLGFVFQEAKVQEAIRERRAFLPAYPASKAALCFKQIAANLLKSDPAGPVSEDMESFWKRYLDSVQKRRLIFEPAGKVQVPEEPANFIDVTQDLNLTGVESPPEKTAVASIPEPADSQAAAFPDSVNVRKDSRMEAKVRDPDRFDSTVELIEVLRALTAELGRIRKILENTPGSMFAAAPGQNQKQPINSIKLDLDAFIKKQGVTI